MALVKKKFFSEDTYILELEIIFFTFFDVRLSARSGVIHKANINIDELVNEITVTC